MDRLWSVLRYCSCFFADTAEMWCWISLEWDILRVAVFYAPIWVVIFITFSLYIRIGQRIFKKGRERRKLHEELEGSGQLSVTRNPFLATGISKTTEIAVTYESKSARKGQHSPLSPISSADEIRTAEPPTTPTYSFSVEGVSRAMTASPLPRSSRTSFAGSRIWEDCKWSSAMTKGEWSYYKCAMLFFLAQIVTWVPSSANRVYSLVFPAKGLFRAIAGIRSCAAVAGVLEHRHLYGDVMAGLRGVIRGLGGEGERIDGGKWKERVTSTSRSEPQDCSSCERT